jgi:hypothetical protein
VEAQPAAPAQTEPLPQLPENPIRIEDQKNAVPPAGEPATVSPDSVVNGPVAPGPVAPGPSAVAPGRPVKPRGPVYYYAADPYTFPGNAATPPPMHIPNSPFVEDLSVDGDHGRYPYYSYRRPWYTPGHLSANVTIVW